jgi:hypothetical protein
MSELYYGYASHLQQTLWPDEAYLTDKFGSSFPEWMIHLGIAADHEPETFGAFRELALAQLARCSPTEGLGRLEEAFRYDCDIGGRLAADPTRLTLEEMSSADFQLLGQQLAATAFPGRFQHVPLVQVELSVSQIHPDADIPADRSRVFHFCLRLLAEATAPEGGTLKDTPLFRFFAERGGDWWAENFGSGEADDAAHAITASARLFHRSTDPEDGFGNGSYSVVIHPAWVPRLNGAFRSAAF